MVAGLERAPAHGGRGPLRRLPGRSGDRDGLSALRPLVRPRAGHATGGSAGRLAWPTRHRAVHRLHGLDLLADRRGRIRRAVDSRCCAHRMIPAVRPWGAGAAPSVQRLRLAAPPTSAGRKRLDLAACRGEPGRIGRPGGLFRLPLPQRCRGRDQHQRHDRGRHRRKARSHHPCRRSSWIRNRALLHFQYLLPEKRRVPEGGGQPG